MNNLRAHFEATSKFSERADPFSRALARNPRQWLGPMQIDELIPKLDALNYLFTESGNQIVAHCLDLDVLAIGSNVDDAERRLDEVVRSQIKFAFEHLSLASFNFHAPPDCWAEYADADEIKRSQLNIADVPRMVLPVTQRKAAIPITIRMRKMA